MEEAFPHPVDSDPEELKLLVLEMMATIRNGCKNRDVNSLMDSILIGTLPIDVIRENLKMINEGGGIIWMEQ